VLGIEVGAVLGTALGVVIGAALGIVLGASLGDLLGAELVSSISFIRFIVGVPVVVVGANARAW
jgi:predicted lysophospholipase L1 biosynthesis ABC-type transport system permease subunit